MLVNFFLKGVWLMCELAERKLEDDCQIPKVVRGQ